jgi:hypothetical protein
MADTTNLQVGQKAGGGRFTLVRQREQEGIGVVWLAQMRFHRISFFRS